MVALPGQLFYSTQIPACLWFLARDRKDGKFRDRRGQVLFIDARKLGRMVDRTHRELADEDIARIANTYHAWREKDAVRRGSPDPAEAADRRSPGKKGDLRSGEVARSETGHKKKETGHNKKVIGHNDYQDIPGFCKSATLDEVHKHGHVLTPGRYVGAEAQADDGEPFDEKMKRLVATLREQQAEAAKLDAAIAANLRELGYGG